MLSNLISYETITFDEKDTPWINSQVKYLINKKKTAYKRISKVTRAVKLLQYFCPFRMNLPHSLTI